MDFDADRSKKLQVGDEVSPSEPSPEEPKAATYKWFDDLFSYYLFLGMTYELYWEGDPWLAKAYRDAYEMKRDYDNQTLWMNGIYVFNAIGTAIANIHLDGKHHAPVPYLKEPIRIRPYTEEELKAKKEKEQDDVIRYLDEWAKAFNEEHDNARN